jgi:hypothetical protein
MTKSIGVLCGLIVAILLLTSSTVAVGGITYYDTKIKGYSELCVEYVEYDTWWGVILKLLHITRYKTTCDLYEIEKCRMNNPKEYDCQPDIIRQCFRDCWEKDLEFDHWQFQWLHSDECWCVKDNIPIQIR